MFISRAKPLCAVQAVQPHLRKCFDAIATLEFGTMVLGPDGKPAKEGEPGKPQMTNDIIGMNSPEGEYVGLGKGLKGTLICCRHCREGLCKGPFDF